MVPLLDQFYYFALTIGIGMVAGFCYDLYKVTRGSLRLRRVGSALGDVLFWVVLTGVVFALLLIGNWGEVRLYVFLGLVLGTVIYLNVFSKQTTSLLQWTFRAFHRLWLLIIKVFYLVIKTLWFPFRMLYLGVALPLLFLIRVIYKVVSRPLRAAKRGIRRRLSSIFPIFEYKDDE